MAKNTPLSEAIIEVGRRFDECELSEIQAAFGAAVATTSNKRKREAFQILLGYAEQAKTIGNPEALGNLAAAFGAAGHPDIATPMFEKACKTDTNGSLLCCLQNRLNLGHFYSQTNRPQEALATYEELIKVWDKRNSQNCVVDSSIYNTIIHMAHIGIFYTARNIGTKLHDEGREEDAIPYLAKALLNMKYLPPSQENAPTGEAYGSPTLH